MRIIVCGRKIPKELEKLGYKEKSAQHLGRNQWIINAVKEDDDETNE